MVEVIDVVEKIVTNISVWHQLIILIVISCIPILITLSGIKINQRSGVGTNAAYDAISTNNATLSFMYAAFSMVIAAILAYAVALAWDSSDYAIENIKKEVNAISSLRRHIKIFGSNNFNELVIDYLNKVITLELPTAGKNEETDLAYRKLWEFIYSLSSTANKESFLSNIISQISIVDASRRTRTTYTQQYAIENPFWTIIIILTALLPLGGYGFSSENPYQRDVAIGITIFVSFSLIILLGQLQFPYSKSNLSDNSQPFISLLNELKLNE